MPLTLPALTLGDIEADIAAIEAEIVVINEEIDLLELNVQGAVVVNMGNVDYTMTDAEANAALKIMLNVGDGTKELTVPPTATPPANSGYVCHFAANPFTLVLQAPAAPVVIENVDYDIVSLYSLYNSFISDSTIGPGWDNSKMAPTQNAVYDALSVSDGDIESLKLNVRDVAGVDMSADNYTLTYDQSLSGVLLPSDVGNGTKILTYPISSQGDIPSVITVNNLGNSNGFFIEFEAYIGVSLYVPPASIFSFLSVDNPVENNNPTQIRSESNGVTTLAAGNTNLADVHAGKLLISADAVAQTLTVNTGLLTPNMVLEVSCTGVGGMTITAGTATVTGNSVLAATQSCKIYRDALTDNYHCV